MTDIALQEALKLIDPIADSYMHFLEPPTLPYEVAPFSYLGLGEFPLEETPYEAEILQFIPTQPTMGIEPKRDLITGEIISYENRPLSTLPSDTADINRQIGSIDNYHRGNKMNIPFFPGVKIEPKSASVNFEPLIAALDTGTNLLTTPFSKEVNNSEELEPLPDLPLGDETVVPNPHDIPDQIYGAQFTSIKDNYDVSNLKKDIPNPACEFDFDLDEFQARSIYRLERNECVFVSAPTSAGKTVVAQYAIALCRMHKMRALYTSPIKALSNQKFRDFSRQFGDVGILTGDVSINREASVLIMTTEILRSMLYRGADILRDVECVIFDECHYISNDERGVVWEESIILMPPHINMVFLSATVPNAPEIASWVARTKQRPVYIEIHNDRPVPLSHSIYVGGRVFNLLNPARKAGFNEDNYKKASSLMSKPKKFDKRSRSNMFNPSFWSDLVNNLHKEDYLPALMFSFSQANCEKFANFAAKNCLITKNQQNYVTNFFNQTIARLPQQDRELAQIVQMKKLLLQGIGVHHGGILPILKETVEILLADGFLKVLFCTSTFAMGINVPVRTTCFTNLRKFNGKEFVDLTQTEYLQMSGRAGRRGLDKVGTTMLVITDDLPEESFLHTLYFGQAEKLESQFYIRFNMILNLIRVQGMKMVDLLKRSLSANSIQAQVPELKKKIETFTNKLKTLDKINCSIGDIEDATPLANNVTLLKECNKLIYDNMKDEFLANIVPGCLVLLTNENRCEVVLVEEAVFVNERLTEFLLLSATGAKIKQRLNDIHCVHLLSPPTARNIELLNTNDRRNLIKSFDITSNALNYTSFFKKNKTPEFIDESNRHHDLLLEIAQSKCFTCSQLSEHYKIATQANMLNKNIKNLQEQCKDDSIQLVPLMNCYFQMLTDMEYISPDHIINVKGRVCIEITTAHEIISTELLYSNFFDDCTSAQIAALSSCLVAQRLGKKEDDAGYLPELEEKINTMLEIGTNVQNKLAEFGVPFDEDEFLSYNINPKATTLVFEWASGKTFAEVMKNPTTIPEGGLVRLIIQVNDVLRNFANAAKIMGSKSLADKFEVASECIKRDIIFAASLYLD